MPDYKKMYFKMLRASEKAMRIIIAAQRECEELYLDRTTPKNSIIVLPVKEQKHLDSDE